MEAKEPRTRAIIGAATEVHQQLGCGFLEPVYQEALALELGARSIPFQREVELAIAYKGQPLHTCYRADFICFGKVVAEIKVLARLSATAEAQVINYLKATGHEVGLLLNFGAKSLEYRRFVFSKSAKAAQPAISSG